MVGSMVPQAHGVIPAKAGIQHPQGKRLHHG
jgi:hypothetical protein